jgi:hypothetical protein
MYRPDAGKLRSKRVGQTGGGSKSWLSGVLIAAAALAATGCSIMPDMSEFRPLPPKNSFFPTSTAAYVGPVGATGNVAASELVDAQGSCSGAPAPAQGSPEAAAVPRGVGLEMTECEVVRALGTPQSAEIGAENGVRVVLLNYRSGDRPGIYRFFSGRLKSIEQGDEPPPVAKKPPAAKKPKSA